MPGPHATQKFSNAPPLLHSKGLYKSDLPTLTVWLWDSQFGMPSHGLTVLSLNLTVNQKTLKLPKNSAKCEGISNIIFFVRKNRYNVSSIETLKQIFCCFFFFFNLMHILEISLFEVPISKFFWTFFQNLQISMWWGLEGLRNTFGGHTCV